jgi:hypothetical protein
VSDQKNELIEAVGGAQVDRPIEDETLNAVIVVKETVDGEIRTKVVLSGTVQTTEVETLLKLGLKGFQEQMGLT